MEQKKSTLAALLKDKPRRGRPLRQVSRQNVYVALTEIEKAQIDEITHRLPSMLKRADVPDLAITILGIRLESMRRHVADRTREIPEGITDLESLYLLWDIPLPEKNTDAQWTSIRVSPQPAIELGRAHGVLNALFGVNRSQVFVLGLRLLSHALVNELKSKPYRSFQEMQQLMERIYL